MLTPLSVRYRSYALLYSSRKNEKRSKPYSLYGDASIAGFDKEMRQVCTTYDTNVR